MKLSMRIIWAVSFLAFCNIGKASGVENPFTEDSDYGYVDRPDLIEEKKQAMLAVPDTAIFYWFSDDTDFQQLDPHAYWLMNRMM